MPKTEEMKKISQKIIDEIENCDLFKEFMELWDIIDYGEKREKTQKRKFIREKIHKMHNSLYAIEQMIEEIK